MQPMFDAIEQFADTVRRVVETASQRRARRDQDARMRGVVPPWVRLGYGETDRNLNTRIGEATQRGNEMLMKLGMDYAIDEVAVLLPASPDRRTLWHSRMLDRVGKAGFTYFNHVKGDVVKCQPLPSQYTVTYDFFTTGVQGVRMEMLSLEGGHSPLHHAYDLVSRDDAAIVHASFKVPDELTYRMALEHLATDGLVCGQSCESSYGRFSYWRDPNEAGALLWLKPRVNLRDGEEPILPEVDDIEDEDEEEDEDD